MIKFVRQHYLAAIAAAALLMGTMLISSTLIASGKQPPLRETPSQAGYENIFEVKVPTGEESGGTGFLIQSEAYGKVIVTNRHVCEAMSPENTEHILQQGDKFYRAVTRIKSDITDLCLIQPPQEVLENNNGLRLAQRGPLPGELIHVEGHPYLKPLTRYSGHFVNTLVQPLDLLEKPVTKWMRMGRMDFMIFPGNSGSPVTNDRGEVVGVAFAMEGFTRNGLYIPLLDLKYFLMQSGSAQ